MDNPHIDLRKETFFTKKRLAQIYRFLFYTLIYGSSVVFFVCSASFHLSFSDNETLFLARGWLYIISALLIFYIGICQLLKRKVNEIGLFLLCISMFCLCFDMLTAALLLEAFVYLAAGVFCLYKF